MASSCWPVLENFLGGELLYCFNGVGFVLPAGTQISSVQLFSFQMVVSDSRKISLCWIKEVVDNSL